MTLLDAIVQSLSLAGEYPLDDRVAPAAILWLEKKRQWESLLPGLRERLPDLRTLGPDAANSKAGPAVWPRCMIARTFGLLNWQRRWPLGAGMLCGGVRSVRFSGLLNHGNSLCRYYSWLQAHGLANSGSW